MPGGRGAGWIHPPASAPGQGTGKKAPEVPPHTNPRLKACCRCCNRTPSTAGKSLPCLNKAQRGARPRPGHHPHSPNFQGRTDLVQHHICNLGQSLGFLHAGKDELETQQKLTVISLLLLRVQRLPLLCSGGQEGDPDVACPVSSTLSCGRSGPTQGPARWEVDRTLALGPLSPTPCQVWGQDGRRV